MNTKPVVSGFTGYGGRYYRTICLNPDERDERKRFTTNIRTQILDLFSSGRGNSGNTRYDLLNGVSDYTDHAMTTRGEAKAEARFESALLSSGAELKQRAFDILSDDTLFERASSGSLVVPITVPGLN